MIYDVIIKGDLFRPFSASQKRVVDPIVGGAIIGGIGSLLNGMFGSSSQSSANSTNLQIAKQNAELQRETNQLNRELAEKANAQNYRMFQEQNAFNVDMWNKQNAYNAPSAQVERLKAAGINPAAVLGSIGTGQLASSLSSASSAPAERANMVAPQLNYRAEPLPSPLSGLPDAANGLISARMANAQIRNIESMASMNEIKADLERQSFESSLLERLNNARRGTVEYEQASEDLKLWRETRDFEYRLRKSNSEMGESSVLEAQERIATAKVEREILRSNAAWQNKLNAASYQSILAGIRQAISAANMNDASAVESAARAAVQKATEEGLKLDKQQKEDLFDAIYDKAWNEASEMFYRSRNAAKQYYGGRLGSELPADAIIPSDYSRPVHTKSQHKR